MSPSLPPLRVALAGQVDHGKSTLVARLLIATGGLPPEQVARLEEYSRRRGVGVEISFLLDALALERDQAVTVDASQAIVRLPGRELRLIDVPGHQEFLRNMITGAATADAALLVVDAAEGVQAQTLRHLRLLGLLGVRRLVVAVNKMDRVGYAEEAFIGVRDRLLAIARDAEKSAFADGGEAVVAVVPVSAAEGEGIAAPSPRMPWHVGPALTDALEALVPDASRPSFLRLPVQDVYRPSDDRVIVGRVESGRLAVGDTLRFLPSGQSARLSRFVHWPAGETHESRAGQSVAIVLEEDLVVHRGDLATLVHDSPPLTQRASALVFWLGAEPLRAGTALRVKCGTRIVAATVSSVETVTDLETLAQMRADALKTNDIGRIVLTLSEPVPVDFDTPASPAGRAVLLSGFDTVGGALWSTATDAGTSPAGETMGSSSRVSEGRRQRRVGHAGGVLWLTGLPGAGKSTLATAAEARLFDNGYLPSILDGDTLRAGISADLGFSPGDRAEQVRRVAHVASLLARAGTMCIVALVSPYRTDRSRARAIIGDPFREIYVSAGVDVCQQRDPKGMYRRALAGDIAHFTGVSDPYEAPDCPDLIIDTAHLSVDDAVEQLVSYIHHVFPLIGG